MDKQVQNTQIQDIINIVEYSEESASGLVWKQTFKSGKYFREAGSIAGKVIVYKSTDYWKFGYNYKNYTNHRVVWILHNGDIPNGMFINHINNNSLDNRIENLELVTTKENLHKTYFHNGLGLKITNKSGITGVSEYIKEQNGKIYTYAHANVRDQNGRKVNKYFRYNPNDDISKCKAFAEAEEWRNNYLKCLVDKGLAFYKLGDFNE